jgi:predicted membrane chloride channel (bestrophin family)
MAVATFFLVVGETSAGVIENPFGSDPNALDLPRICSVIETTVGEILGVAPTIGPL